MRNLLFALIALSIGLTTCKTVPITGRKQVKLLPSSTMNSMSFSQYNQFLQSNNVVTGTAQSQQVKEVGNNIKLAVEKYFRQKNMMDELEGFQWEFNLVQDPTINAWCMPGGKVVIYTGIMPIAQDADGLAVVMGHEVAHAIANHGNERMSQGLVTQFGGMALSVALRDKPQQTQALFMQAYGVGTTVGATLPFSRLHESEADELGLIFSAMAGYNPEAAIPFWQRMDAAAGSGGRPPEFMSTHPHPDTRVQNLRKVIPKAKNYASRYGTVR